MDGTVVSSGHERAVVPEVLTGTTEYVTVIEEPCTIIIEAIIGFPDFFTFVGEDHCYSSFGFALI
jgi:hypothetical protein